MRPDVKKRLRGRVWWSALAAALCLLTPAAPAGGTQEAGGQGEGECLRGPCFEVRRVPNCEGANCLEAARAEGCETEPCFALRQVAKCESDLCFQVFVAAAPAPAAATDARPAPADDTAPAPAPEPKTAPRTRGGSGIPAGKRVAADPGRVKSPALQALEQLENCKKGNCFEVRPGTDCKVPPCFKAIKKDRCDGPACYTVKRF